MPATQTFALPPGSSSRHGVAPWWAGLLMLLPTRRLGQSPRRILAPHVHAGQTVLEVGPAMGFFTPTLAELVGPGGRVHAVDCQSRMLRQLRRRLDRAGLADRVEPRACGEESLRVADLAGQVDLTVAINVVHEAADPERMIGEMAHSLRPGGRLLMSEPRGHVSRDLFLWQYGRCREAGLRALDWPRIFRQRTVLLERLAV
jgi:SAM-dependent methyltransferase